jgi:hypothetical protein
MTTDKPDVAALDSNNPTDWQEALDSISTSACGDDNCVGGWEIELLRRRIRRALRAVEVRMRERAAGEGGRGGGQ